MKIAARADENVLFLIIGKIIQSLLAIVSIRFMTEMLAPESVGQQYLINSIILWFSLVLVNPVGMFVNRHLHDWKAHQKVYVFIRQLNKYFLFVAIGSIPIIFFLKSYMGLIQAVPYLELIIFIFCYLYLSTWFQTLSSFFNLLEKQKDFVVVNVLAQALGVVLAIGAVKWIQSTALAWMSGLLLGQIISLIYASFRFHKIFPEGFQEKQDAQNTLFNRDTLQFCYPIALTTLFMWFLSQGYRIVIEQELGAEILAAFGVGLGIAASISSVVESLTTQYFYPKYYAALSGATEETRRSAWLSLFKNTSAIYVPCFFLTLMAAPLLVRVLASARFSHIVPYVAAGALVELFRQLSNIAYIVSHAEKKTKSTIAPYLLGAAILLAALTFLKMNSILIVHNILFVLCVTAFITYVYNFRIVKKLINIRFDYRLFAWAILLGVPALIVSCLNLENISTVVLLGIVILAGLWTLISIAFLFKKLSQE